MTRLIDADALIKDAFDLMDREELMEDVPQIIKDYCDAMPTVDAIPVSFIEAMINEQEEVADYEFESNGGYCEGANYELWAMKRVIEEWREKNEDVRRMITEWRSDGD